MGLSDDSHRRFHCAGFFLLPGFRAPVADYYYGADPFHRRGMLLEMFTLQFTRGFLAAKSFGRRIGLVLLLFTDASRTDLGVLKNIRNLPARLLSTGMLLTLLLGALGALVVFRDLSIWEAGILAAILAPTDAGLGQTS